MNLADIKEMTEIFQNLTTITAVIVGGFWSYKIFIQKRQKYPRATIEHKVIHRSISSEEKYDLLSLDVIVSNNGDVLLKLESGEIFVKQMLPLSEKTTQDRNYESNSNSFQIQSLKLIAFQSENWKEVKRTSQIIKK
jgi:hypothetical protein